MTHAIDALRKEARMLKDIIIPEKEFNKKELESSLLECNSVLEYAKAKLADINATIELLTNMPETEATVAEK